MPTVHTSRPPVKPSKPARKPLAREVECYPAVTGTGADFQVTIWTDGRWSCYWLRRLVSAFGVVFNFEQSRTNPERGDYQSESYDVLIGNAQDCSCECPGFLRWGAECKHLWSLRTLIERGEIEGRRAPLPDPAWKSGPHDDEAPF